MGIDPSFLPLHHGPRLTDHVFVFGQAGEERESPSDEPVDLFRTLDDLGASLVPVRPAGTDDGSDGGTWNEVADRDDLEPRSIFFFT
jgi:hypothetical protein